MTDAQIKEAIGQVKTHCDLLMPNYEMVSLRSALYTLGYGSDEADEVINYCAANGFDYCIDSTIKANDEYPSDDVCWWGPDQLKSRLWSVR